MQKDKSFVVIDIETTGLNSNPNYGEVDFIIEVAAVRIEQGKITEKFSSFCACPIPLPEEIVKLTGISNEDLKNSPSVKQVLKNLRDFCKDSEIVGHNISFDLGFLNYYGAKYKKSFNKAYADTLAMSRRLLKNKLVNYRLATVAEHFKLKFKGHRALSDALVTAKIFLKLSNLQEIQEKATKMIEQIVQKMIKQDGVTEEMKQRDQMKWTGLMNNYKLIAEEQIMRELIYN